MKIILAILTLFFAGAAYYYYDANEKTAKENESKIENISNEKEDEITQLKGTFAELLTDMEEEIEQGQIKITQLSDRLSVVMIDKVLFPSGEAEITPEGLLILERVGNVLKNTNNKIIRVEGHTDNKKIHKNLQTTFPTNWELSTARATNVVRILQERVGIEGNLLQSIGMSEYHPVATNDTPEGRSQNRRIDIALLP
ncbi:MAG: flagellar motor protein MotB [Bacteroidetes bacterium]|nr:flagellar motor protein MotB [Bacteroidota bacterium]